MNWLKSLGNGVTVLLIAGTAGCSQAPGFYDDGMDTVQHLGNGRFQVVEGSPRSYSLEDATKGIIVQQIVSWRERGRFAYVIGAEPQQFFLIDLSAEKITPYMALKLVPAPHQVIFKSMFGKKKA